MKIIRINQKIKRALSRSVVLWFFLLSSPASGASWESYIVRPDITSENVVAQEHYLGPMWEKIKRAQLETIAEIFAMYPDYQIYFLARDAELLYDLARLLTSDVEHPMHNSIHILNISRANMRCKHAKEYLAQNGINQQAIRENKKIILVDTGYQGTISRKVEDLTWPVEGIKTHLLCSLNKRHPSSRVFLTAFMPEPNFDVSQTYLTIIHNYEKIPRYTNISLEFQYIDQHLHPMSKYSTIGEEKELSRKHEALEYMEDLKKYFEEPNTKKLFDNRISEWNTVKSLFDSKPLSEVRDYLDRLLESSKLNPEEHRYHQALKSDFYEIVRLNYPENESKAQLLIPAPPPGQLQLLQSKDRVWRKTGIKLARATQSSQDSLLNRLGLILLYDSELDLREAAAHALGTIPFNNDIISKTLVTKLTNEESLNRNLLLIALSRAKLTDPETLAILIQALESKNKDVLDSVGRVFQNVEISDRTTFDALLNILNHRKMRVRRNVIDLFQRFPPSDRNIRAALASCNITLH